MSNGLVRLVLRPQPAFLLSLACCACFLCSAGLCGLWLSAARARPRTARSGVICVPRSLWPAWYPAIAALMHVFFFVPFRCSRLSQECPLTFLSSSSSPVCTRRQASANRGFISRPRSEPLGMRHHTPCWDPGTRQTVRTKKPPLCHCIDTVPPPSPDTRCHIRGVAGSGVRIQLLVPSPS